MSSKPVPDPVRALRNALGKYATGIAVITTTLPDGRSTGVTVNSFGSVSLDPPLVQFSLGRTNSLGNFEQASHFCVNVLAQHQRDLSNAFTRPAQIDWANVPHRIAEGTGLPVLLNSLAAFECERYNVIDAGDHRMFFGRVLAFVGVPGAPLLYFQGAYCTIMRDEAFPVAEGIDWFGPMGWGA